MQNISCNFYFLCYVSTFKNLLLRENLSTNKFSSLSTTAISSYFITAITETKN